MTLISILVLPSILFAAGDKYKTVYMNNFEENSFVQLESQCKADSKSPVKFINMHGKACNVPANAQLKVISRSIEPVKEAGTVGEENGYRLRPGMETYVLEHQQSKEPCRFQVSDLGNGFSKFIPHQNGKKIDACIVEKGESKKPTATTKPSPQGGKSEASR